MGKLIVHRKAYTREAHGRKGYKREDGTRVKKASVKKTRVPASTFSIKDRGRKGRGPKVLPPLKKGALGVSFSDSAEKRRRRLREITRSVGERKVGGRLRAVQVLNKRTNKSVSRKAKADARYIYGSFKGKKFVGKGKGFGRNK